MRRRGAGAARQAAGPRAFAWVDDPADTAGLLALIRRGVVGLPRPDGAGREAHWRRVLAWYGLAAAAPAARPSGRAAARSGEARPVICISPAFAAAARFFAGATGRPLHQCAPRGLGRALRSARGATIVGAPTDLGATLLQAVAMTTGGRTSVLTGTDLPGVFLLIAKQLARGRRPADPSMMIDAAAGVVARVRRRGDAVGSLRALSGDRVRELLRSPRGSLVLLAHGEGGHALVGPLVLCGVTGPHETGPGGPVRAGCALTPAGRRCKRAVGTQAIASFAELRAAQVCLLTCNGFATARELYPSDVSAVLALAEGYPAAIVTTARPAVFDHELARAAALLLRERGARALVAALNDVEAFRTGSGAYVLVGDPGLVAHRTARLPGSGRVRLGPGRRVTLVDLGGRAAAGLVARGAGGRLSVLRGARTAVVARLRAARAATVVLASGAAAGGGLVARVLDIGRRLPRLERHAVALRDYGQARGSAGARAVAAVERLRGRLAGAVHDALRRMADRRRLGVWRAEDLAALRAVETLASAWDPAFADALVRTGLLATVDAVLLDGVPLRVRRSRVRCPRCATPQDTAAGADPLVPGSVLRSLNCPVCGMTEVWEEGGPRILVRAAAHRVRPGGRLRVSVRLRSAPGRPIEPRGRLVVEFADKASGRPFWSRRLAAKASMALTGPVHASCTPDLHTLRVAWVGHLGVAVRRLRIACLPEPCPPGREPRLSGPGTGSQPAR